jgi:NTE family protein
VSVSRVVLVFSGGGVKAAAHIGAWRAITEAGLVPSRIVGTSMGAIIGAALASGCSPDVLSEKVSSIKRGDVASLNPLALLAGIRARSVLRASPLQRTIGHVVPARRFSDLELPLTVTTTDLDSGELVVFGAGGEDAPLIDVLYASAALPVYYPSTVINGRRLGDGGIRSVLPLEIAAKAPCDLVIAIDTGPGFEERSGAAPRVPPLMRAHGDAVGILMAAATQRTLEWWRRTDGLPRLLYLRPKVESGVTFEVEKIRDYESRGYTAAVEMLQNEDGAGLWG